MIDRNVKKKFVKQLSSVYQGLFPEADNCELSRNLLRLHIILSLLIIISFFVIRNKYYQLFIIFGAILVILSNIIFNGCIITMVERDLCPGAETVVDWPLEIFGFEINNQNRRIVTILNFGALLILFLMVFFYTHYK